MAEVDITKLKYSVKAFFSSGEVMDLTGLCTSLTWGEEKDSIAQKAEIKLANIKIDKGYISDLIELCTQIVIFVNEEEYFRGIMGTKIPKGFAFSTVSTPEESGIVFYTVEECEIAETGIAEVECVCAEAGKKGNVAAETILLIVKPMKGIVSVVNKEKAYGGYEQETEDSFRQRIAEFDASLGNSFVGSPADYRRWALEVAGVGAAKVISAKDDTGLVTIVLTDNDGMPVQQSVCEEVENHIMRYDSWYERLAPINAYLSVVPAEPINIEVSAVVELEQGYDIEQVKQAFLKNLREYFKTEEAHTEVKYAEVGAVLIYTEGVWDYQQLKVNDGVVNIEIAEYCVAVTEENSIFLYYQ